MSTLVQQPAAPEEPKGNVVQRLIGVFFSPTQTFADIARRPSFIPPLLVLMLCSTVVSIMTVNRVGVEQIVRKRIESNPRVAEMPAEQRDQMVQRSIGVAKVMTVAAPLVFPPLVALVIAGVLMLMVNFVFGGQARFPVLFSVVAHGMLPGIVAALLALVTLYMKNPADIDVTQMVTSNLGPLFEDKVLRRLGTSLDLFSFWQLALLAVGVSAAARFPFKKSLLVVAIPWALWVLGAVGLAAIF